MKIAILYSGFIRNLAETISNNLNCFDYGDIDLYFSVWDKMGYANQINSPDFLLSKKILDSDIEITEKVITDLIPKNITVKTIKIEKYDSKNCKLDLINGIDNPGLPGQFYKVLDCFNSIDSSTEYDVIVRLRCDILLNNKIDKKWLLEKIQNNKIIFTNKLWHDCPRLPNHNAINDMIWVANKPIMQKACNIYNNTNEINKIIKNSTQNHKNFGEHITFMNLVVENIVSNIELFDFNYNILR